MKRIFWLNFGCLVFSLQMMSANAETSLFQVKSQIGMNEGSIGEGRFNKYNSKEVLLSVHQFVGTYPMSFGFSLGREMIHPSSIAFSRSVTEEGQILRQTPNFIHNDELAVEFQAWMPDSMTGGRVRPFIKSGYTVWSNYRFKGKLLKEGMKQVYTEKGQEQGASLAIGSQIKLNKDYSAVFELRYQAKTVRLEDSNFMTKRKIKAGGALLGFTRLI
ncbi:MAG: hypothetical protein AB8G05_20910 [Oligoflexales bacterium]